jgi:hypothetical protein
MKVYCQSMDGQYMEPFTVEVSRVDDGFYQYKKSMNTYYYNDFGILGLVTEPTQVYSNVQNGVGLVGAQSPAVRKTIVLTGN